MTIAIVSIDADDWMRWKALRLSALSEAPQAFGSLLSEWQDAPEESWRDRLTGVSLNLIAQLDGSDAGMVSGVTAEGEVELISMWVAPFARGRGMGDALIDSLIQWTASLRIPRLVLHVVSDNERATALYARRGFQFEQADDANGDATRERLMARPS